MKKLVLSLFIMLLTFSSVQAQDTIYKRNGELIVSKIIEVNPTNVKYKKFEYLDGPLYSIEKSEVFMIRYQNGLKDVFEIQKLSPADDYAAAPKPKEKSKFSLTDITDNPITINHYNYSMGVFSLAPSKVDQILLDKADPQLSLMIKTAQSNKRTSKLLSFAPIPCGVGAYFCLLAGVTVASTNTYSSTSNSNANGYLTYAGIFAVAGVGTAITAIILNARSKQMRKQAVELYNQKYFGTR